MRTFTDFARVTVLALALCVSPSLVASEVKKEANYLPPAFVAEKFGVKLGDKVKKETAEQIIEEASEIGEKSPNFFKVAEDEVLMLPEVFSNLKVDDIKREFAEEGNDAAEQELRNTRWWGRLYIDGWPQTIQYLRAHFGDAPPQGVKRIVLADPIEACETLNNAKDAKGAIVIARRGTCTFGTKGKLVEALDAEALVIVNNVDGNDHPPGPDAHDLPFSVSMVTRDEGELLVQSLQAGSTLTGSMIPIHCNAESKVLRTGELCQPTTAAERRVAASPLEGGWFTMPSGEKFEFMIANFGVRVPIEGVTVMTASPPTACEPLSGAVKGKAALVHRGGCNFIEKAETVHNASASMVIIVNSETGLSRLGVEPRWRGLKVPIPVVMVTDIGGEALTSLKADETVSFTLSRSVNMNDWRKIEERRNGEGWGRTIEHRETELKKLLEEHAGFAERIEAINKGFALSSSPKRKSPKDDL